MEFLLISYGVISIAIGILFIVLFIVVINDSRNHTNGDPTLLHSLINSIRTNYTFTIVIRNDKGAWDVKLNVPKTMRLSEAFIEDIYNDLKVKADK